MAFREVSVNEIREVLRVWLGVAGLPAPGYRTIAAHCGVDRKTVRRYVEAAHAAGLRRGDDAGTGSPRRPADRRHLAAARGRPGALRYRQAQPLEARTETVNQAVLADGTLLLERNAPMTHDPIQGA